MCSTTRDIPTKTSSPVAVNRTARVAMAGASGRLFGTSRSFEPDCNAIGKTESQVDECDDCDQRCRDRIASKNGCDQPDHVQKNAEQDQAANQAKRVAALPET